MKLQWILIVVLAVLLIVAVIFATNSFPDVAPTTGTQNNQTDDTQGTTEETLDSAFPTVSYEEYQSMSGEDRQAYYEKFPSASAFNAWLNAARAAYEADRATIPTIDGDKPIDIGGLLSGNNG